MEASLRCHFTLEYTKNSAGRPTIKPDMASLNVEFDSLVLADATKSRSTVHVNVAHPTPLEEAAFGKLYFLIEIDSADRINHDIIIAIQEELRSAYYRSTEFAPEVAFEHALQAANSRLHRYVTEGVTTWVDHFNAIVVAVKNDLVVLSAVGRVHSFLFRGNRISDIIGKSPETGRRNPLKMFGSVLTGHLEENDRLLVCTSSLLDFFSQEKLKRMIVEDLPSGTVAKIEQTLLATPTPVAFGALFFAFLSQKTSAGSSNTFATSASFRSESAPQRSMEDLIAKERATEELLSPKIIPGVGQLLSAGYSRLKNFVRTDVLRQPPRRHLNRNVQSTTRFHSSRFSRSLQFLQRILARILLVILALPRLIVGLANRQRTATAKVAALPMRATSKTNQTVRWFRSLTPLQIGLVLGAIVALFILSQTVISLSTQKNNVLKGKAATEAAGTIQENIDKANAALTYDDIASARRLIQEAADLLARLPKKSKSDRDVVNHLQASIDAARMLARKVVTPELKTIADLQGPLNGSAPTSLALAGTSLVIGTENRGILRVTVADGTTAKTADDLAARFTVGLDASTVAIGKPDNTIATYTVRSGATRDVSIAFQNTDRNLVAGSSYLARLYLLDPKNNSILRAPRAGTTSFGSATQWLKTSTLDLRESVGLAVDGTIYVLMRDGSILRLTAGLRDDVSFEQPDPKFESPVAIWTSDRLTSILVLDPQAGRIVAYSKTSRIVTAQYHAEEFKNAVALTVDERANTVYVLTKDKVSSFQLKP